MTAGATRQRTPSVDKVTSKRGWSVGSSDDRIKTAVGR